jgi:hypothetical protein
MMQLLFNQNFLFVGPQELEPGTPDYESNSAVLFLAQKKRNFSINKRLAR